MLDRIGRYRIVSELGRGGMGVVYKAHEESLNRFVAIKVLGEHLDADPVYVERFLREAQSAARLNHPNIVQIYSVSEEEGSHYFVMEYVSGVSLSQLLRSREPLDEMKASRIILQTAAGLQAAHEQGVIHRDIKPANLLIDDRGLVKIADFGLALMGGAVSRLTATGMFMGTPGYLSPEQCLDREIDHRTDIYSLGVTFFEALTGRVPFAADSPLALLRQIVEVEPPDLGELKPGVDEGLRALVARMMAKDREQRPASCAEIINELRPILEAHGGTGALADSAAPAMDGLASASPPDPRLDTHPTEQVPSGAKTPGTPPSPHQTAPAREGTVELVEAAPNEESQASHRGHRLALVAALVIIGGIAALAVGGLAAWKFGLFDGVSRRADRAASAVAGQAMGAAEPTPAAVQASSSAVEVAQGAIVDGEGSPVEEATGPTSQTAEPRNTAKDDLAKTKADPVVEHENESSDRALSAPPVAAAPPSKPAPPPEGTVVIAFGEPLFAGEAEAFLERVLARAGVKLVDENGLPEAVELMQSGEAPRQGEVRAALAPYARNLVLIRVEYLGERPLQYMGQADVAFQARCTVVPIDLWQGKALADPETVRVEYTHLNAERVAETRLRQPARHVLTALSND
ncbi:MAG: serine/threonine-protein kinase [Acidobacteriota bacterium]